MVCSLPYALNTPYRNTIAPENEAPMPGDIFMERRIRSLAHSLECDGHGAARQQKGAGDLGGHIASFASSAMLIDVGFNHFSVRPTR